MNFIKFFLKRNSRTMCYLISFLLYILTQNPGMLVIILFMLMVEILEEYSEFKKNSSKNK